MAKLSPDELKKLADEFFKQYPKEKSFWATEDGQFFLGSRKNYAIDHAKKSKLSEPVEFKREEVAATEKGNGSGKKAKEDVKSKSEEV